MHRRFSLRHLYRLLLTVISLYLVSLLLCYPSKALGYAFTGVTLWFQKMIPVLLPFMILSGIMIRLDLTAQFTCFLHPVLHRVFGTSKNGSYTILMGFLCGFPMGARIVGELYSSSRISRQEAAYLLAFCNNIGPIYFLSYVIPSLRLTTSPLLLFAMYGIPLCYGALLRLAGRLPDFDAPYMAPGASALAGASLDRNASVLFAAIDRSIVSGLVGIAKLGGYMVFFNLLNILWTPLPLHSSALSSLGSCILEITSGIGQSDPSCALSVLVLLPFGGFSCIAQTYSMISDTDLSISGYVFHKVIQTFLTFAFYAVCVLFAGFHIAG